MSWWISPAARVFPVCKVSSAVCVSVWPVGMGDLFLLLLTVQLLPWYCSYFTCSSSYFLHFYLLSPAKARLRRSASALVGHLIWVRKIKCFNSFQNFGFHIQVILENLPPYRRFFSSSCGELQPSAANGGTLWAQFSRDFFSGGFFL